MLDRLEADETLSFTLDGQLATVDDYVEIRPESEERIRSLVEAGRLALGPWQTLMDEFLVDGETTLRNLEAGMRRAEQFGGAMRVGYLPDMFGHVAQMPQILRAAGIETAVVWRGVPAAVDFHRFVWEGIDGSSVVAEYLPGGYGNAAYIFDVPGPVDLRPFEERFRPWFGSDPVLGMVGTDHKPLVHDFSARVPDGATVGTVGEYLADAAPDGLLRWRGELRSAARANLLPGVVSARIDLKAACARAERWLERYAEPLQALYGGTDRPEPFLAQAWTRMFQNSAHDSICGCSTDDVSAEVLARYAEAEHIGRELAQRAVAQIAAEVPRGAFAIVNPSPRERTDLVELDVVVPDEWEAVELELPDGTRLPTQEVRREAPFEWKAKVAGAEVAAVIARRLHGREIFGRIVNGFRIEDREAILQVGDEPDPEFLDVEQLVGELSLATAEGEWTLRVAAQPKRTIVAAVPAPPLGWTSVRPVRVPGTVPGTCPNLDVSGSPASSAGRTSATVTTTQRPRTTSSSTFRPRNDSSASRTGRSAGSTCCTAPTCGTTGASRRGRASSSGPASRSSGSGWSSTTSATTSACACTCHCSSLPRARMPRVSSRWSSAVSRWKAATARSPSRRFRPPASSPRAGSRSSSTTSPSTRWSETSSR